LNENAPLRHPRDRRLAPIHPGRPPIGWNTASPEISRQPEKPACRTREQKQNRNTESCARDRDRRDGKGRPWARTHPNRAGWARMQLGNVRHRQLREAGRASRLYSRALEEFRRKKRRAKPIFVFGVTGFFTVNTHFRRRSQGARADISCEGTLYLEAGLRFSRRKEKQTNGANKPALYLSRCARQSRGELPGRRRRGGSGGRPGARAKKNWHDAHWRSGRKGDKKKKGPGARIIPTPSRPSLNNFFAWGFFAPRPAPAEPGKGLLERARRRWPLFQGKRKHSAPIQPEKICLAIDSQIISADGGRLSGAKKKKGKKKKEGENDKVRRKGRKGAALLRPLAWRSAEKGLGTKHRILFRYVSLSHGSTIISRR